MTSPDAPSADNLAERHDSLLAPYAVKHGSGLGREHQPNVKPRDGRLRFAVDEGRIIHSPWTRALLEKTQVYSVAIPERATTRGNHTEEVAYLSRHAARRLGLNEDLAASVARAHDFGHPPFGHDGQDALHEWMKKFGLTFEHNEQTLRIVTMIDRKSKHYRGLNLNRETLEALDKHDTFFKKTNVASVDVRAPSMEAQLVNLADKLSYIPRDIDDGSKHSVLDTAALREFALYREAEELAEAAGNDIRSELINLLASDMVDTTERNITKLGIASLDDVYGSAKPIVALADGTRTALSNLKKHMYQAMYDPPDKQSYREAVHDIVRRLCDHFRAHPSPAMRDYEELSQSDDADVRRAEAVRDHVSSLTDREAIHQVQEVGIPLGSIRLVQKIFGRKDRPE